MQKILLLSADFIPSSIRVLVVASCLAQQTPLSKTLSIHALHSVQILMGQLHFGYTTTDICMQTIHVVVLRKAIAPQVDGKTKLRQAMAGFTN